MATRSSRAAIAAETLSVLQAGRYYASQGECVQIGPQLRMAVEHSVHYRPADFRRVFAARDERLSTYQTVGSGKPSTIEVINCTTLAAARRIIDADPHIDPLCLNFASAKNPGGGFLGGSQAQEESLARGSGLYVSLKRFPEMYEANRACGSCLYLDHMIYSPQIPVFRDDEDQLLDRPYFASFLTAPAVNRGALAKNDPEVLPQVEPTMQSRIEKLLSIAVVHAHDTLVLGAWGCGVFRNDPADVARWFHQQLVENPVFQAAFRHIVFAVLDREEKLGAYRTFCEQFQ